MIGNQNSKNNISLLLAQRKLYNEAKSIRSAIAFFSIGIAVFGVIVTNYYPMAKNNLAIIAVVWSVIATYVLQDISKKKAKQAAIIQEEFDVDVFQIPWNKELVGHKLNREMRLRLSKKYKGRQLENWYQNIDKINYPQNVLLCQRENLVLDWRLRRDYGVFLMALTIVAIGVEIIIAYIEEIGMSQYLLGYLFPSMPAINLGIQTALLHLQIAKDKESKEKEINSLFEQFNKDPGTITAEKCRRIQDSIYLGRVHNVLIPNIWFKLFEKKFRLDTEEAANEIIYSHFK